MTPSSLIEEILDHWEDEREQGRDLSVSELCRDHPSLAGQVGDEIRLLKKVQWMDRSCTRAPTVGQERAGDLIDERFRLKEQIGEGGFGVVWLALDLRTERAVAVKFLHPQLEGRVRRDDQTAGDDLAYRPDHDNIVPLFDSGWHGKREYFVTKFINGATLAATIRRGPVQREEALRIIRDVAQAVESLHRRGIIHRDLTPANILIDTAGKVHVIDFGLAVRAAPGESVIPSDAAGTVPYMAPERLRLGCPIDHRCDLYALGVILFELLTGRRPFAGGEMSELGLRILGRGEPDLSALSSLLHHSVHEAVRRCLAEHAFRRFASVGELIQILNIAIGDPEPVLVDMGAARPILLAPEPAILPQKPVSNLLIVDTADAIKRWRIAAQCLFALFVLAVLGVAIWKSVIDGDSRPVLMVVASPIIVIGVLLVRPRLALPAIVLVTLAVAIWLSSWGKALWDDVFGALYRVGSH